MRRHTARTLPVVVHAALLISTLAMSACASSGRATGIAPQPAASASGADYIVVRHAEKGTDDPRDPALSDAGRARATTLRDQLRDANLVAAYATSYRRTQQTAQPAAIAHGLGVETYDPAWPAAEFAARLRREHTEGTVLIVGHSNTVPPLVNALCGCEVSAIDESDYANLYDVHVDADGRASLTQRRY